jgi:glycosyltransferase involved in cell wall biosynthesis
MTAPFPSWPTRGACEHDRAEGIKQLNRMGHDVLVLTLLYGWQSADDVDRASEQLGIPIRHARYPEPWIAADPVMVVRRAAACVQHPGLLDGSSYEYSCPDIRLFFEQNLAEWRPDLVWFDHTSAWFLLRVTRRFGIPVVFRSHNFEPFHFLDYHGWSLSNSIKFAGKLIAEYTCARNAAAMVAISPDELAIYDKLVRKAIHLLPLRSLPYCLRPPRKQRDRVPLEVFFFGSTFNVMHNREGVWLLVQDIMPALRRQAPGQFRVHVLGGKLPDCFNQYAAEDLVFHGFVEDLEDFLDNMDIAVSVSCWGHAGS